MQRRFSVGLLSLLSADDQLIMLLLVGIFEGVFHGRRNRNRSGVMIRTH